MRPTWDELYMSMCYLVASKSPDRSTHSGCVIVDQENVVSSTGYNGFPRGVEHLPERQFRPTKYFYMEHSERNAIYNANRKGVSLQNSRLYVNWMPCADCSRAIIQTGIKEVIVHKQGMDAFLLSRNDTKKWTEEHDVTIIMFSEANVCLH